MVNLQPTGMDLELLFVTVFVYAVGAVVDASFKCYDCGFSLSSDTSLNYDCVTKPWNVRRGNITDCQEPNQCFTRVVFAQDSDQIRSATRACLPKQDNICEGERCCNRNSAYPTCEHKCQTDLCNKDNPETWRGDNGIIDNGDSRFTCYSCSYTLSSDASINYDCVTEPWNVTRSTPLSCQEPYQCVTRAVFNQDFYQVRSVARTCLSIQDLCEGDKCCSRNGPYPICEHKCRNDLCNNESPETWRGGISSASHSHVVSVMVLCLWTLIHGCV